MTTLSLCWSPWLDKLDNRVENETPIRSRCIYHRDNPTEWNSFIGNIMSIIKGMIKHQKIEDWGLYVSKLVGLKHNLIYRKYIVLQLDVLQYEHTQRLYRPLILRLIFINFVLLFHETSHWIMAYRKLGFNRPEKKNILSKRNRTVEAFHAVLSRIEIKAKHIPLYNTM